MSKHYYFQKLLFGEIVSDEEYKKIIIIKLNKHLVIRGTFHVSIGGEVRRHSAHQGRDTDHHRCGGVDTLLGVRQRSLVRYPGRRHFQVSR